MLRFDPNFAPDDAHDFVLRQIDDVETRQGGDVILPTAVGSYRRDEYVFQEAWANAPSPEVAEAAGATYEEYSIGEPYNGPVAQDGETITLYAVWKRRTATVAFRADYPRGYVARIEAGAELARYDDEPYVQEIGAVTGQIAAPTAVAHPGYRFLFWIDDATKLAVSTQPTWAPAKTGAEWPSSMAFRAKYKANAYRIAFDANGGSGKMAGQIVIFGRSVLLQANAVDEVTGLRAIRRKGHAFAGWNTRADGSGESYGDGDRVRIGAAFLDLLGSDGETATLYAVWEPLAAGGSDRGAPEPWF